MRHLLILTCLLFGTGATAEEGDFDFNGLIAKKALRDYKKAVAKDEKAQALKLKELDEAGAKAAKSTRDAFVENLKKALKQSMQAGNLEEANKIDAAIKALKKGASPAGGSVAGSVKKNTKNILPDGIYLADYGAMDLIREFRKKGDNVLWAVDRTSTSANRTNVAGRLRKIGKNLFEIKYENGNYCRWWIYEKHILVENWDRQFPRQQYERPWFTAVINRETGYRKK